MSFFVRRAKAVHPRGRPHHVDQKPKRNILATDARHSTDHRPTRNRQESENYATCKSFLHKPTFPLQIYVRKTWPDNPPPNRIGPRLFCESKEQHRDKKSKLDLVATRKPKIRQEITHHLTFCRLSRTLYGNERLQLGYAIQGSRNCISHGELTTETGLSASSY